MRQRTDVTHAHCAHIGRLSIYLSVCLQYKTIDDGTIKHFFLIEMHLLLCRLVSIASMNSYNFQIRFSILPVVVIIILVVVVDIYQVSKFHCVRCYCCWFWSSSLVCYTKKYARWFYAFMDGCMAKRWL